MTTMNIIGTWPDYRLPALLSPGTSQNTPLKEKVSQKNIEKLSIGAKWLANSQKQINIQTTDIQRRH